METKYYYDNVQQNLSLKKHFRWNHFQSCSVFLSRKNPLIIHHNIIGSKENWKTAGKVTFKSKFF